MSSAEPLHDDDEPPVRPLVHPDDPRALNPPRAADITTSTRPCILDEGWDGDRFDWDPESRPGRCIAAFATGNSAAVAARLAHLNRDRVSTWRLEGKLLDDKVSADDWDDDSNLTRPAIQYLWFYRRTEHARATVANAAAESVQKGVKANWKAGLAVLERMDPEAWGQQTTHRIVGHDNGPVKIEHDALLDPNVMEAIHRIQDAVTVGEHAPTGELEPIVLDDHDHTEAEVIDDDA